MGAKTEDGQFTKQSKKMIVKGTGNRYSVERSKVLKQAERVNKRRKRAFEMSR